MMLQTAALTAMQQQVVPTIRPDTTDTAVVHTPLPGGVGSFVRTVLNAPSWLQITVIAASVVICLAIVVWLWFRRAPIIAWLGARSHGWKIALAAIGIVALSGAAAFGTATWNYTQHNNDFCIGCHVMGTAWSKFQHSEHRKLKCHDCHQQSLFASMRQLYLWVAERPNSIPAHAKVPTTICQNCHNQEHPDSAWKRVTMTAGHSVHLRNDKRELRNVQCVTCHGAEVHHFVPIDKTCGQSGCHEKIQIKLGKMAAQTSLHCTGCHNFTSPVGDNVSPDSARTRLVPTGAKCLDCHQMKQRLATTLVELDPAKDPHKAVCGACHDPHKQATTKQAFETCATAQCHARADTLTPFHRGLPAGALANCGTCHKAHIWKVPSKDCVACHRDLDHPLRGAGARKPPPGHPTLEEQPDDPPTGGPFVPDVIEEPQAAATPPAQAPRDTGSFSHARHKTLQCLACHSSDRTHGELTFTRPAGCSECHHGPAQKVACATCHRTLPTRDQALGLPATVPFSHARHKALQCSGCHSNDRTHGELTVTRPTGCLGCHHNPEQKVPCAVCHQTLPTRDQALSLTMTVWNAPRSRTLTFAHDRHTKVECKTCHTTPSTLVAETQCVSCHGEHHAATATCASCHPATPVAAQTQHPRQTTHAGCGGAGCHRDAAILALPPSRGVCLACHREQTNHKPGGDCATCHLINWQASGGTR
jgi:hypothetical protein